MHTFSGDHLHATGVAPAGAVVAHFEPACIAPGLAITALPDFLSKCQNDASTAIDLVLIKPDSRTWLKVLTGEQAIDDLSTEEALSLKHIAARTPNMGWGVGAAVGAVRAAQLAVGSCLDPPPSSDHVQTQILPSPLPAAYMQQAVGAADADTRASATAAMGSTGVAEPDVSAIWAGLQRAAAGKCTIKFGCPAATKGCPFMLEVRRPAGSATADVWQTCSHQFHDPTSAAERGKLKPHPALQSLASLMIEGGVKPASVTNVVGNLALAPGDPLGLGIGSGSLGAAHFSNGRISLTQPQVKALKKQIGRAAGFGVTSDAQAVALYVSELEAAGCLGYYQPYKAACGQGRAEKPEQPLVVVTQTPFQQRMMAEFGQRMVFMDTTFGVTRNGFALTAMLVRAGGGP